MAVEEPLATPTVVHADRLARGALLQQGAQIARLVAGLIVITLLVRTLPKGEYGVYAILLSFVTYVQFVKSAVMNAAVVGVAEAGDDRERLDVVVSTGFAIYAVMGVLCGAALLALGLFVLELVHVPSLLQHDARVAVGGLSAVVAIGWPVQIFDDVLRGTQRFAAVSAVELLAAIVYAGGVALLVLVEAPVWLLVDYSASISVITGLACLAMLPRLGVRVRVVPQCVRRAEASRFAGISSYVVAGGVADLTTYSVDRVILSAGRGPRAVAYYEGPLQVQNMIRFLNGVLTAPVVPAARRFLADRDMPRVRELFLKGLRYNLALTLPLVVVCVALAGPIVQAWFGDSYADVSTETAAYCAWWFLGCNIGMAGTFLVAGGRFRTLAVTSWIVAMINLPLALLLVPHFGISGVIAAAVVSFVFSVVVQFPLAMRVADVGWGDVVRVAWLPGYSTAAVLLAGLLAFRSVVDVHGVLMTGSVACASFLLYGCLYLAWWSDADERGLARRTLLPRRWS